MITTTPENVPSTMPQDASGRWEPLLTGQMGYRSGQPRALTPHLRTAAEGNAIVVCAGHGAVVSLGAYHGVLRAAECRRRSGMRTLPTRRHPSTLDSSAVVRETLRRPIRRFLRPSTWDDREVAGVRRQRPCDVRSASCRRRDSTGRRRPSSGLPRVPRIHSGDISTRGGHRSAIGGLDPSWVYHPPLTGGKQLKTSPSLS